MNHKQFPFNCDLNVGTLQKLLISIQIVWLGSAQHTPLKLFQQWVRDYQYPCVQISPKKQLLQTH